MNKRHWVSVILDGKMEDDEIVRLIGESYDLTAKK
jgi:predicted DNA-binding protein (MmcQ/YjbR family)